MTRIKPKPRARKPDLYAGYRVQLADPTPDVFGQYLFLMLDGPLAGECRWFKPSEIEEEDEPTGVGEDS